MKKTFPLFLIFTCLLLAIPAQLQAQAAYDYQAIDYPGAAGTQVWGINSRGLVVGNGWAGLDDFPFVYNPRTGTFIDVMPLAEFTPSTRTFTGTMVRSSASTRSR